VLLACSGGSDSTAMLHVLAGLREVHGWRLVAHGVDHGLRPAASEELELVRELADSLDVPFERSRVEVAPGSNLQARAREARYEALRLAASRVGARAIATAHTADDRAETVIMRLLRGAPAAGLAVLAPSAGDLLRPLVRARRRDVALHLERHGLRHASDPSNLDARFVRVRVRREVMPLLEQLSPRVVETLAALADELSEGDQARRAVLDALPVRYRRVVVQAMRGGVTKLSLRTDEQNELRVDLGAGHPILALVPSPRKR
jgi:tRNA(Ile)-lysidine synthase